MLNPVIEQQSSIDAPYTQMVWSKGRVSSRYGQSDQDFFTERLNGYLQCLDSVMQAYFSNDADEKNKEISYEKSREAAIKSHLSAFPLSVCSADCLRSQLDEHYTDGLKCDDDSKLKYKKIGGGSNAR